MGDGLQVENQFALFAFANPDFLFWNFLESALGHSYSIVFEFEIWDAQLAALRELLLKVSVEENFRFLLTGNHDERAQILSGFQEGAQRGRRSRVNVELILVAAAGHG